MKSGFTNRADIDQSKIVWANNLSMSENLELINYYHGRKVWVWNVGTRQLQWLPRNQTALP